MFHTSSMLIGKITIQQLLFENQELSLNSNYSSAIFIFSAMNTGKRCSVFHR